MTSTEIVTISDAAQAVLKNRIHYFLSKKAIAVLTDSESAAYLTQYAKTVLRGNADLDEWFYATMTNGTVAALTDVTAVTDNDLSFVVMTEMFPQFAKSAV